ncbi:hypothetical protein KC338_g155 [Hortaea werneckii]|nr:hypothetical protein KC338_g155 [Hortaea werneckii]
MLCIIDHVQTFNSFIIWTAVVSCSPVPNSRENAPVSSAISNSSVATPTLHPKRSAVSCAVTPRPNDRSFPSPAEDRDAYCDSRSQANKLAIVFSSVRLISLVVASPSAEAESERILLASALSFPLCFANTSAIAMTSFADVMSASRSSNALLPSCPEAELYRLDGLMVKDCFAQAWSRRLRSMLVGGRSRSF